MFLREDRGVFCRLFFSGTTLDRVLPAGCAAGCVAEFFGCAAGFTAGFSADCAAGLRCVNDAKADESCSDAV